MNWISIGAVNESIFYLCLFGQLLPEPMLNYYQWARWGKLQWILNQTTKYFVK